MKRIFTLVSLAMPLGVAAWAQNATFSKGADCKTCCHDNCKDCCPGGCPGGCCQSK